MKLVGNDTAMVQQFCQMFADAGANTLIGDLDTDVRRATIAGHDFPLTYNDGGGGNCYLVSPSRAYIDYAIDETRNFARSPVLQKLVRAIIYASAPLVKASGLDRQVQLNNWLFSTNPMPDLNVSQAQEVRDTLTAQHPDKAIVIRSLNDLADSATMQALRSADFVFLPSRQIYIVPEAIPLTKNMKADRSKMRRTSLQFAPNDSFKGADFARCERLYNLLYLDKYTPLNPHYTHQYLCEMHRRGILRLAGFRDDTGQLVAVTGLFENGRTLTQPIVGYDTTRPIQEGLYRMVMAIAQDYAFKHGLFFNMSAGAAEFKRRRGAVSVIEYSAVYTAHLPFRRRMAVRVMATILERIGVPLLQRFEL